jgi:hypothetical protein
MIAPTLRTLVSFASSVLPVAVAVASLSCGASTGPSQEQTRTAAEAPTEGRVGVHAMVVFGPSKEGGVYLSGIPNYAPPNDLQYVIRARLSPLPGDFVPKLLNDGMYTLEPDTFSLDKLVSGQTLTFEANLYQGNYVERAKRLAHGMKVDLDAMVFPTRPLDAKAPRLAEPTYVAFGTAKDTYLVHLVGGSPDFDQILYGNVTGGIDDAGLAKTISLVRKGKKNDVQSRILTHDKVSLSSFDGRTVQMEIVKELSCFMGDGFNEPCPL